MHFQVEIVCGNLRSLVSRVEDRNLTSSHLRLSSVSTLIFGVARRLGARQRHSETVFKVGQGKGQISWLNLLTRICPLICNILSLNIPVTDELLVVRLVNLLGYVISVDYRL